MHGTIVILWRVFKTKMDVNDMSYLYSLQGGGGLCHTLRRIEAFGGADLRVDQPLLKVSQGGTKALLQQPFFILALPGGAETETAAPKEEKATKRW